MRTVRAPGTQPTHSNDRLLIKWIGVNSQTLRLDLGLDRADPHAERSVEGSDAVPTVSLMVDGCVVDASEFRPGRLGYGGPDLRVLFARKRLPKGELTLDFGAHGQRTTMLFLNDEHGLRPMEAEESKRHYEIPEENVVGTVGPDCNPDGTAKQPLRY
jgi:hypothetical protein